MTIPLPPSSVPSSAPPWTPRCVDASITTQAGSHAASAGIAERPGAPERLQVTLYPSNLDAAPRRGASAAPR